MGITEISGAATAQPAQPATPRTRPPQANEASATREPVKTAQEIAKTEAKDKQPRPEELQSALQKISEFVSSTASEISFSVDNESGRTVVKVTDRSTKEVIRQIPSQEFLEMSKALDHLQGLLLKNKA